MNRKAGDWNCPSCDHVNYGWREVCQRCSEPKPAGDGYGKGGDGGYSRGGQGDDRGDYRRRSGSYGFGAGYNSGSGGSSGSYYGRNQSGGGYGDDYRSAYGGNDYNRGYGGGSDVRPGDWLCQESGCGAHNFASRSSCFKCGAVKEEGGARAGGYDYGRSSGYDSGSRGFGKSYESGDAGPGGRTGWKSGDWICTRSGCNEHNFASRNECFRCKAAREA